ncbi:phytoene desaturase family protein [Tunturiibacter lichenicola]|uniref:phytoene desaturase family protein n=1 Tax=Tunturiibacter lichenicola TaxID=2051959 RepID=UPI0021B31DE4|nr:FAD-dependent oxidoreductase [Edaphobacter lichenicola]
MSHFVVIGGGIAGLTAANALATAGSVTLLERSHELGGRARTINANGYLLNLGPHALTKNGITAQTFHEWGIQISGGDPAERGEGKRSVIMRDGVLYPAANNFTSLIKSRMFSLREKLELAKLLSFTKHEDVGKSESVNEWLSRSVRSERVRQYVRMGLRTATYGLEFDHLAARDALRQLALTMKPGVLYIDGGWQVLVDGLTRRAGSLGVEFRTGVSVERLSEVQADGIVIATDRHNAQRLSGTEFPPAIPAYAACLDLCLRKLPQCAPTVAFAVDRPLYYSVHSAAAKLAPKGHALVHVMKYLSDIPDDSQSVRRELEEYLDIVMPGWRDSLVKDRFLPHIMVSAAVPTTSANPAKSSDIDRVAFAGEWVTSRGLLADAAVSSALEAARSVIQPESVDTCSGAVTWELR